VQYHLLQRLLSRLESHLLPAEMYQAASRRKVVTAVAVDRSYHLVVWALLACVNAVAFPDVGCAQDRWGIQARADAASRAIVLAVEQGISALPPTSGQSLIYEYNPRTDVFDRSEKLGPFSLRAPETVGEGNLSVRAAASYFALPATLGPIDYQLKFDDPTVTPQMVFAKFGTEIDARVGVFDLTVNYGITRDIEANLTLPIVVVDAQAQNIYSADPTDPTKIGFRESPEALNTAIAQHELPVEKRSFTDSGF